MAEVNDVPGFSCGVQIITNLKRLDKDDNEFRHFVETEVGGCREDNKGVKFLFTDNSKAKNGVWFAKKIKQYGLGKVDVAFRGHRNPWTGNNITLWVWTHNGKNSPPPKGE